MQSMWVYGWRKREGQVEAHGRGRGTKHRAGEELKGVCENGMQGSAFVTAFILDT
jgi:hypothetical protein